MKAMTYNIRSGRNLDNQLDIRFAAQAIGREMPDFCALNEVRSHSADVGPVNQAEQLAALTGMQHYAFGKSIDFQGGAYGNGFLSRWPIEEQEVVHIPDREGAEGKHLEHRSILRCVVNVDGTRLTTLTSHFGLNLCEQEEAVKTVLSLLAVEDRPVVLMGDFNALPGAAVLEPLFRAMTDTAGGSDEPKTYPSGQPEGKIDYIFAKGLRCLSLACPDTQNSDHRPLVAVLGE